MTNVATLMFDECVATLGDRVFPVTIEDMSGNRTATNTGITKRELFAVMAMQGYCTEGCGGTVTRIAACAVDQADALIKALETPQREGKES